MQIVNQYNKCLYLTLYKLGDSSDVYCQPLGNNNGTEWASLYDTGPAHALTPIRGSISI